MRLITILGGACLCTLCFALSADAQERTREDIEPDRPDVTNGTHIVDIGLLQIEIGGLYTHTGPRQHAGGTPFTARVGLFDWPEARIRTHGFMKQTHGFSSGTGNVHAEIGAKL